MAKVIYAPENDPPRNFEKGLPRIDVFNSRVLAQHRNMTPVTDKRILAGKQTKTETKHISQAGLRRINREELERLAVEHDIFGHPTWRALAAAAALETGLPVSWGDVMGKSRKRDIVHARGKAICAVWKGNPRLTLTQVGNLFRGRDHSTVAFFLRKHGAVRP
jgi:hypothetical protein